MCEGTLIIHLITNWMPVCMCYQHHVTHHLSHLSPLTQIYCQPLCLESPHSARCFTTSSAQCSAGESVYIHHKGLSSFLFL